MRHCLIPFTSYGYHNRTVFQETVDELRLTYEISNGFSNISIPLKICRLKTINKGIDTVNTTFEYTQSAMKVLDKASWAIGFKGKWICSVE